MIEVEKKKSLGPWVKSASAGVVKQENFVLVLILLVLVAVMGVISGGVSIRPENLLNILLQSSIVGIAAIGQAFVILTGGIDLAVASVAILSASVCAVLTTTNPGFYGALPLAVGLIAMLATGAGVGAINGVLVSRFRIPALIVTLGVSMAALGVTYKISKEATTVGGLPEALSVIGHGNVAGIPVAVLIFAAVAVIAFFALKYTSFGRRIYAVGSNEKSAWLTGVRTKGITFWVYVISGGCAAMAGMIQLSRINTASVRMISNLELDAIAAVVIGGVSIFGGRGTLVGVLIGVLILAVINNGMNVTGLNPFMQYLVKGSIIALAVAIDALRKRGSTKL